MNNEPHESGASGREPRMLAFQVRSLGRQVSNPAVAPPSTKTKR